MVLGQSDSDSSMVVKSSLHLNNAWNSFNECRHQGNFCDVVIRIQDARFPVHRLVLCACSDYFRSLFLGQWKSTDKQEIEIPGVSPRVMSSLLNFAYTGQVTVTSVNVEELLPAADQFLISYVKDKCCAFLKRHLTPKNCIGIRQYARSYYCMRLVEASTRYILHHFEEVSQLSEEYLFLPITDVEQIIRDDRLNVHGEESVCEAIFRWVIHDRRVRLKHLTGLLKCVRLGLLEPEYFMIKVKGNELVMECIAECRNLIKEAMKVVCDLHAHAGIESLPTEENLYNLLLRPRLPIEVLLAIGGWSGGSPTNAIEAYDPKAENWLNVSTLSDNNFVGQSRNLSDIPRAYHGVAYVSGFVYVIGGFDGVHYFNTVRKFDVSTFEWTQELSMMHNRCYISVAVLDKKIYALGGMNGESRLNSGECYDPYLKHWALLPDMNERRSDASATSMEGRVYIAGGFNGQECLFTAEFYESDASVWTRITPMRSRRSGVSIISYHGLIYAVGGFDGVNRLRHAEAYNPLSNTWRNISSMGTPRSNFGIEVIDDRLLVVGGYNGQRTSSAVEAYEETTNEWCLIKDMDICRSALSCCIIRGLPHEIIKKYCLPRDISSHCCVDEENFMNHELESSESDRSDGLFADEEMQQIDNNEVPEEIIVVDDQMGSMEDL
ncbi:kelch-like protein 10 [Clavelina lepadiformis]|uniref:kelch-like protein 10 n=1 Tax=Clavelina lepadiformis TaxID=159417 RepID=UPI004042F292